MSGADDLVERDQIVASIAAATVLTLDARPVRLREFWAGGTVVTTFLRHFGCLFCHRAMTDIVGIIPDVLAKGATLVFVGNGSVEQAKRFFTEKKLPREGCSVVTDPERESYRAAELRRGYLRTFANAGSVRAYQDARESGHRITGLFGDLTQLGGVLVTRPPAPRDDAPLAVCRRRRRPARNPGCRLTYVRSLSRGRHEISRTCARA